MTVLERLFALEQFGIKLGLHNIIALTVALGRPQDAWPAIHIAGTNGKGSVTAMVERALRDAGHRTGRYTSPHLSEIEERIAINGEPIGERRFAAAAEHVLDLAARLESDGILTSPPTFFEATTAIAFEVFKRERVDVAVIEVGLGGRFDATNVLHPMVTAITSIALDHERHLGHTRASIAFEKAGIAKPHVPMVLGQVDEEARNTIATVCRGAGAPIVDAGSDLIAHSAMERGHAKVSLRTPVRSYDEVRLGLAGRHQAANAAVAVRVLEQCAQAGLRVDPSNIVKGLTDVHWPARLEWLAFATGRRVLIDAAHNPAGAEALAQYLADAGLPRLPLMIAAMRDKDVVGMVRPLIPHASRVIATEVASARSLSAGELADRVRTIAPLSEVVADPDPEAAMTAILGVDQAACAAGSIFLIGPLRARLLTRGARPGAEAP